MTTSGSPHDVGYVRAISRQLLLGLDFLHQFATGEYDVFSYRNYKYPRLLQPPEFSPVKWLEGTIKDDSPPKYLTPTQRRRGLLDNANWSTLVARIGDLGGAQWIGHCDEQTVTALGLRAPELVQQDIWDAGIDIWCLGCSLFELATNEPPFPLGVFGLARQEIDNDHNALIDQRLSSNGQRGENFTNYLRARLPNFTVDSVESLASFLLLMLQKSRQRRLSAKDLLQSPFCWMGLSIKTAVNTK
ncbi:hypothetical protein ANOM_007753 [Aspergillus nomiae NRRL 13137]|uniref:non-specific serine/threonine protein kinase n=1 Tax=Aspergillus nomiae NRRL (strain ATCC 15546 / NRRL 13137 / CBS 260.88 / M93) TaxID=1509407 RepID=A0A0L1IVU8_ASPN3|nr:uncharacterized protein ANOM_007753 [Aspergillus nomiae NRRL 13137]KNG83515.1 hypothetical protein ANOM_007753 [Aspergillus nomiae NRRL 13137]